MKITFDLASSRLLQYAATAALLGFSSIAAASAPLALFGTPLKGATRSELRQTLSKAGFSAQRVDDGYFCDQYSVDGQLKGATQLTVCYTENTNRFASAEYTFPGFMDTQLVQRVIHVVESKYGRPSSVNGDIGLGGVTARWNVAQGMALKVSRGWPDTTTYLDIIDRGMNRTMHAQMQADKAAAIRQQAAKDANAF
ncbi:hypothetical protein GALL_97680 [mine drainage metagenome]|uniref:Uncharacterized protein n=1 Tax=mine drainage metagenome TaxID=410659 RepID=A0A1J5SHG7_9ZZZZ